MTNNKSLRLDGKRLVTWLVILLSCISLVTFSVFGNVLKQEPRKSGTDSSGYSILAKSIRKGDFSTAIDESIAQSAVLEIATRWAGKSKIPETGLAPLSFRYNNKEKRHLSQYPIGTSLLMSLVSSKIEVRSLIIAYIYAIFAIFMFLLIRAFKTESGLNTGLSFIVLCIYIWYARSSQFGSFSVYPSTVLTLFSGVSLGLAASRFERFSFGGLRSQLLLFATALSIGVACFFRISNILVVLPAFGILVGLSLSRSGCTGEDQKQGYIPAKYTANSFKVLFFGLCIGLIPLFTSNIIISGNLFFTNYPGYDREVFLHPLSILGNIEILSFRGGIDGLILVVCLILLLITRHAPQLNNLKLSCNLAFLALGSSVVLVSSKRVVAAYYVTSVCTFIVGFCLSVLTELPDVSTPSKARTRISRTYQRIFLFIIPLLLVFASSSTYTHNASFTNDALNTTSPEDGFLDDETASIVIWTDEESGFLYNNYGLYGLSTYRLPKPLKIELIKGLKRSGIQQYIEVGNSVSELLPGLDLSVSCRRIKLNHVTLDKVC